jgi:hypothetical protein
MSFTVVPLHNLTLDKAARASVRRWLRIADVPEWLQKEAILKDISFTERQWTLAAKHALVVEYTATAIGGEPDPDWKGKEPRSIQEVKAEKAILANLALWLTHPTLVCFANAFHAISWSIRGEAEKQRYVQQVVPRNGLVCCRRM